MRTCGNEQCTEAVTVRSDREGLIHANGKYICRTKNKGQWTAAK